MNFKTASQPTIPKQTCNKCRYKHYMDMKLDWTFMRRMKKNSEEMECVEPYKKKLKNG